MNIYFSDFFKVEPKLIEMYGAFNVSLIRDLPLFIDPFLLFNSEKKEYQDLHEEIIRYVTYLKIGANENLDEGRLLRLYKFSEVKQNWLGYSKSGNNGRGLGGQFADNLNRGLHTIFSDFGSETITRAPHLEKLCLVKSGVGRDNISDFTTNLIKHYLLEYTQDFARKHVSKTRCESLTIGRTKFNYETGSWMSAKFDLPVHNGDYVLLTPRDILTKDETWINRTEMLHDFRSIVASIPNSQLRDQINQYIVKRLPKNPKPKHRISAALSAIEKFPAVIDYYIRQKENRGEDAVSVSAEKVRETEQLFVTNVRDLVERTLKPGGFYSTRGDTYDDAYSRVKFLKHVIENNDGYRIFYLKGKPIQREGDLQILYALTWHATDSDVNREVNNGRGPVDYKISRGRKDSTLVEFKLAKNTSLEKNLKNQVAIYQRANRTEKAIKVIIFFSRQELNRTSRILKKLKLENEEAIVLVDARKKPSASKAKSIE